MPAPVLRSRVIQGATNKSLILKILCVAGLSLIIVKTVDDSLKDYSDYAKESSSPYNSPASASAGSFGLDPTSTTSDARNPTANRDHFIRNPNIAGLGENGTLVDLATQ